MCQLSLSNACSDVIEDSLKWVLFLFQVIEIPRGSKVKYELDKKTGLIKVKQCDLSHLLL